MKAKLSRPPLARMQRIHDVLQRGAEANCSSLARTLEVSVKTVQRDLVFMRDRLGLPIEYDTSSRSYGYAEAVESFPTIQVSEGELTALLVAEQVLAQYRGTPFEAQLRTAFEKLTAGLVELVSFSGTEVLSGISFRSLGTIEPDVGIFKALSRAVLDQREVTFAYRKPGAETSELRRVQPYHLAFWDNFCYLIGHDVNRGALRQFALSRMGDVTLLRKGFVRPDEFSVERYFAGAFGAEPGEDSYDVRIEFDASAAFYIRERQWHSSQQLEELPQGGVELSFRLTSLVEVERWVLGWGRHARALAPTTLVERIRESIAIMGNQYVEAKI